MSWVVRAIESGRRPREVKVSVQAGEEGKAEALLFLLPTSGGDPHPALRRSTLRAPDQVAPKGATLLCRIEVRPAGASTSLGQGLAIRHIPTSALAELVSTEEIGPPGGVSTLYRAFTLSMGDDVRTHITVRASVERDLVLRPASAQTPPERPSWVGARLFMALRSRMGRAGQATGAATGAQGGVPTLGIVSSVAALGLAGYAVQKRWDAQDANARADAAESSNEALQAAAATRSQSSAATQIDLAARIDAAEERRREIVHRILGFPADDALTAAILANEPSRRMSHTQSQCAAPLDPTSPVPAWVFAWHPMSARRCELTMDVDDQGIRRLGPWGLTVRARAAVRLPMDLVSPDLNRERAGLAQGFLMMKHEVLAAAGAGSVDGGAGTGPSEADLWALFWWDMANQLPEQPGALSLSICTANALRRLRDAESPLAPLGQIAQGTALLPVVAERGCTWQVGIAQASATRVLEAVGAQVFLEERRAEEQH